MDTSPIKFVPKTISGATQAVLLSLAGVQDDITYGKGTDCTFVSVAHALFDILERGVSLEGKFLLFLGSDDNPQDVTNVCLGDEMSRGNALSLLQVYGTAMLDSSKGASMGVIEQHYRRKVKNVDSYNPKTQIDSQQLHITIGGTDNHHVSNLIGVQPLSKVLIRELVERKINPVLNNESLQAEQLAAVTSTNLLPSSINRIVDNAVAAEDAYEELDGGRVHGILTVLIDYATTYPKADLALRYYGTDVVVDAIELIDTFNGEVLYQSAQVPNDLMPFYIYPLNLANAWWKEATVSPSYQTKSVIFDVVEGRVLLQSEGDYWTMPMVAQTETLDLSGVDVSQVSVGADEGDVAPIYISIRNVEDRTVEESLKEVYGVDIANKSYRWFSLSSFPERNQLDEGTEDLFYTNGWGNKLVTDQTRARY